MLKDITFSNYKKDDIHGAVLYPATMVAPVQKIILDFLFKNTKITSVYDPFHGSGTALYEAATLSNEVELYGCDINPLANLITKVKLQGVSKSILKNISLLEKFIYEDNKCGYSFKNIDKWFRKDIKENLIKIRQSIIKIKNKKDRLFFWCILSTFIRKYSNTRSETFKLHIKKDDSITRIKDNLIESYIVSLKHYAPMFIGVSKKPILYKEDVINNLSRFKGESIDLLISSPPYGDNPTTVTYGEFSSLSLFWIDKADLELEGWELNSYAVIDTNSLGKNRGYVDITHENLKLINIFLSKIRKEKQKKVLNFFDDYFK